MKKYIYLCLLAVLLTGCSGQTSTQETEPVPVPTEPETIAETTSEMLSEENHSEIISENSLKNAPFPEADPNAITFDDGNFSFVSVVQDDDTSVKGTLSIEFVDGNAMLKFTDNSTNAENLPSAVQKISISANSLLEEHQLESVAKIAFDLYTESKTESFSGSFTAGGGTTCINGEWFNFPDFSVEQCNLQRSDANHVEFAFPEDDPGKRWDSTVEKPEILFMRWNMETCSDFYLDNLTFYDEEGNAIPLNPISPENGE